MATFVVEIELDGNIVSCNQENVENHHLIVVAITYLHLPLPIECNTRDVF